MSQTKSAIWESLEGEDGYIDYPNTPDPYPDTPIEITEQQAADEPPF